MTEWPEWMNDPIEMWRDTDIHSFLRNAKCPLKTVSLDAFISWMETDYHEAYSFICLVKYWRNKYYEEHA